MGKAIAIFNQKGGVGKTTTNINLAACLALKGKKVLILDIDPQGNTTSGIGIPKRKLKNTIYNILIDKDYDPRKSIIHTNVKNLDLIPASVDLAGAEVELVELEGRESTLKKGLDKIKGDYDYIFIDCPPSLGLLTVNALTAAHSLLIQVQAEYYALAGLELIQQTMQSVREALNPSLSLMGVLLTFYDKRKSLNRDVAEGLRESLGDRLFSTCIRDNVALAEAPSNGKSIFEYRAKSFGAQDYGALANEFLARTRKI